MSFRAAVPNVFGTRDQFRGRQLFMDPCERGEGGGSGGNASDGERQMQLPLLTAHFLLCGRFLRSSGLVPVCGPGVGGSCFRGLLVRLVRREFYCRLAVRNSVGERAKRG